MKVCPSLMDIPSLIKLKMGTKFYDPVYYILVRKIINDKAGEVVYTSLNDNGERKTYTHSKAKSLCRPLEIKYSKKHKCECMAFIRQTKIMRPPGKPGSGKK